jgi:hypothetical protein
MRARKREVGKRQELAGQRLVSLTKQDKLATDKQKTQV